MMASRKRKQSSVNDERPGVKKQRHARDDDDGGVVEEVDEALLRRLSRSLASQPSQTDREAGIIEEVRVMNFMSHSKLNFRYVIHATHQSVI